MQAERSLPVDRGEVVGLYIEEARGSVHLADLRVPLHLLQRVAGVAQYVGHDAIAYLLVGREDHVVENLAVPARYRQRDC